MCYKNNFKNKFILFNRNNYFGTTQDNKQVFTKHIFLFKWNTKCYKCSSQIITVVVYVKSVDEI